MSDFLTIIPSKDRYRAELLCPARGELLTAWLSPHDRSRSFLASLALKTEHEWFLWIDDDMVRYAGIEAEPGFTPEQVNALFETARERYAADEGLLTSGVYVCRHMAAQGLLALNFSPFFQRGEPGKAINFHEREGGVHRIVGCGFGFVFTHRSVFELMDAQAAQYDDAGYAAAGFEQHVLGKAYFLPMVDGSLNHLGEDRSFCVRVHEQRLGKMFVDTRVCVYHDGYSLQDLVK